jgi:hypothetical protein
LFSGQIATSILEDDFGKSVTSAGAEAIETTDNWNFVGRPSARRWL